MTHQNASDAIQYHDRGETCNAVGVLHLPGAEV